MERIENIKIAISKAIDFILVRIEIYKAHRFARKSLRQTRIPYLGKRRLKK